MLRHRGFLGAGRRSHRACSQLFNVGEGWQQSNAGARKRWFRRLAIRLDLGTVDLGELSVGCAPFWREQGRSFESRIPGMPDADASVLIIDDDPEFRDSVVRLLRSVGLHTQQFSSVSEFLKAEPWEGPT